MRHILKSCIQDSGSISDSFSPSAIESDLGLSMHHVARARLADAIESIQNAAAEQCWPAASALEIAFCILDGASAAAHNCSRIATSSCHCAEALIHFSCRHSPAICDRLQPLVVPLIQHQKLLSDDARISLCAAFVPWCDHELTSAMLNFRALGSEECHMRVLRQAAVVNRDILLHFVSHIAALQRRSPRSLFVAAFALSATAFDDWSISIGELNPRCSTQICHSTPIVHQLKPSLAVAFKLQGMKRRVLQFDSSGIQMSSQDDIRRSCCGSGGPDEAHALRCSYVSSLLRGLHAEVASVRSYISSKGNAFELLPLMNWLLAARASRAIDDNRDIGLGQLEATVRSVLDNSGIVGCHAAPSSLLEAIITVAASAGCSKDNERSVSGAIFMIALTVSLFVSILAFGPLQFKQEITRLILRDFQGT
jgi:hypothetical protein